MLDIGGVTQGALRETLRDALLMAAASDALARHFAALCRPLGAEYGSLAEPHLEGTVRGVAPHAAGLALLLMHAPLEALRPALLAVCGQLLPSFTPAEAARVLDVALPALIGAVISRCHPPLPPTTPAEWRAAMAGAELELLCRSMAALEQYWDGGDSAPACAAAAEKAAGNGMSAAPGNEDAAQQQLQRRKAGSGKQEAFDAMLVHISALCHRLTAAADPHALGARSAATVSTGTPAAASVAASAAAGSAAGSAAGQATSGAAVGTGFENTEGAAAAAAAADAAALGANDHGGMSAATLAALLAQRAFSELAAAVTAAARQGLACGRASTLLLHLLKVCCQQPLQRGDTPLDNSGGGSGGAAANPAAWQTAEGIPYSEILEWLQSRIGEGCPGRDTLRFGLQRLASDRLSALSS